VLVKVRIFFVMLDLSNDHDTFFFIVYEQYLSFENRLSTINIRAKVCHVTDNEIYDVSKSASETCPDKEIGRRQNLSRYTDVIISNDTITELDERWRFRHGSTKYRCY